MAQGVCMVIRYRSVDHAVGVRQRWIAIGPHACDDLPAPDPSVCAFASAADDSMTLTQGSSGSTKTARKR